MFKNNIVLRLRALWRNRTHAAINILGLSLGITSSILIFLILRFEMSYDTFRNDSDRIYRVVCTFAQGERTGYSSALTYPLIPAMRSDFPDAQYVSLVDGQQGVIRVPRSNGSYDKFKESNVAFVDSSYFDIIEMEWLQGDKRALTKANAAVLTKSIAEKYFGNTDPINKVINFNNEFDVTVTGVVKDPPLNTDFRFGLFITNELGATKRGWEGWGPAASNVNCVIKLHEGVGREQMEAKMKGWHMKYFTGDLEDDGRSRTYILQPLSEMHFDERFWNHSGRIVSKSSLITLALIGSVLLLTACVNFINLNTVLIIDRSKEAGVRKVMGSTQWQLVNQFLSETVLITLLSLLLSAGLVELMLMVLSPMLGYRLEFSPFGDPATLLFLVTVVSVVSLLAGLYPALKLASFQPTRALKKIAQGDQRGMTLRRSLIVFQLVISQVLIVSTVIAVQQLDHFMKQPLGLNSHAVVEIELPRNGGELMRTLSDRMLAVPGVENVTMSNSGTIAGGQWGGEIIATLNEKSVKESAVIKFADQNFLDTYGLQLLHGEDLTRTDTVTRFIVNEALTRALGFQDPKDALGTLVELWGRKAYIRGIVKDFNANSLHHRISSTIIGSDAGSYHKAGVRLSTQNMTATLANIQKVWEDMYPDHVYEMRFLDDVISGFYNSERRVTKLVGMFAGVAIFIGCIGLFGLVSFMARSRTKEVGIRKSLGASVGQVIGLFSKEFLILIGISFVLSVPIANYFMGEWLKNFEYRIQPGIFTFGIGVLFICVVVLATVGIRAYKAAVANPIDALRDE